MMTVDYRLDDDKHERNDDCRLPFRRRYNMNVTMTVDYCLYDDTT